jgi:hypothetical protein
VDAHQNLGRGKPRPLEYDQLITPDTDAPISKSADAFRGDGTRAATTIEHDKVIAESMAPLYMATEPALSTPRRCTSTGR